MSETKKAEDWRTLDAGNVLNRIVAERLGWRILDRGAEWYIAPPGQEPYYLGSFKANVSLNYIWDYAFANGDIPRFSRDANAALPVDEGAWWDIHVSWTGKVTARIVLTISVHIDLEDPPAETALTLAHGRVRAWLAYTDRLIARYGTWKMETTHD